MHVAMQSPLGIHCRAEVHDDRAGRNHRGIDQATLSRRGEQDFGVPTCVTKVARRRVAHRNGGALSNEQKRERSPNDRTPPDHRRSHPT
jgi:hypothetical protein